MIANCYFRFIERFTSLTLIGNRQSEIEKWSS